MRNERVRLSEHSSTNTGVWLVLMFLIAPVVVTLSGGSSPSDWIYTDLLVVLGTLSIAAGMWAIGRLR